jgi:hypothetical protein
LILDCFRGHPLETKKKSHVKKKPEEEEILVELRVEESRIPIAGGSRIV